MRRPRPAFAANQSGPATIGVFGGYERWRALHRLTGLFVAAGFAHGVLDGTPVGDAPLLRWSYVAIGGIGVAFYVYRELLARFFLSLHDYEVDAVKAVDHDLVEIVLRPLGRHALVFMCGPQGMLSAFTAQFRAAGIPSRRLHREYFDWR